MKARHILLFALVLSGLSGCATSGHSTKNSPSQTNASNSLVPIFEMAVPMENLSDYGFLAKAQIGDFRGTRIRNIFHVDLGLGIGPLLMVDYELDDEHPASKSLAFFKGDLNRGYQIILPDLCYFYAGYRSSPQESCTIYANDVLGDGRDEVLLFSLDKKKEHLVGIYRYDKDKGIFVYHASDPIEGVKEKSTYRALAPLTPREYLHLRNQGPIAPVQLGGCSYSEYDIKQSQKAYKP